MRRRTRGTQAVEFALLLPVMLGIVSGIVDYGWFLQQRQLMLEAARNGARAGSVTPPADDPAGTAGATTALALNELGFLGETEVEVEQLGVVPHVRVRVIIRADFEPFFGLVPTPDAMDSVSSMRLEEQPEP